MSRHVNMSSKEFARLKARTGAKHPLLMPRNKYNAVKTEYNGRRYDSKMEARAAADLDARVAAGEIASWRPQVQVVVPWPGTHEILLKCRLDFQLTHNDGHVTYLEIKGVATEAWKLRLRILTLAGVPVEVQSRA